MAEQFDDWISQAISGECKSITDERDALRAEVERLRDLLSEAADALEYDAAEISDLENTLSSYRENWRGASIAAHRIRDALKGRSHE